MLVEVPDMLSACFAMEKAVMNVVGMNRVLFVGEAVIMDKKMYLNLGIWLAKTVMGLVDIVQGVMSVTGLAE